MRKFIAMVCVLMIAVLPACFAEDNTLISFYLGMYAVPIETDVSLTKDSSGLDPIINVVYCYNVKMPDDKITCFEFFDSDGVSHTYFAVFDIADNLYTAIEKIANCPDVVAFVYAETSEEGFKFGTYSEYVDKNEESNIYNTIDDFVSFLVYDNPA